VIDNDGETITVEGTIFAFGFSKKYDLSLLLIEGLVLDRCQAFDRLASVDAHLSVCLPPHQRRGGGVHTRRVVRGWGSIFRKTPDIGLTSYSIIPLWSVSTHA
jgi:hypothetical protein